MIKRFRYWLSLFKRIVIEKDYPLYSLNEGVHIELSPTNRLIMHPMAYQELRSTSYEWASRYRPVMVKGYEALFDQKGS